MAKPIDTALLSNFLDKCAHESPGGKKIGYDAWFITCKNPEHKESSASLHVTFSSGKVLFDCKSGGNDCRLPILESTWWKQIQELGGSTKNKAPEPPRETIDPPIIPVPDLPSNKELWFNKFGQKAVYVFTYVTEDNKPAYYFRRFDIEKQNHDIDKTLYPLAYFSSRPVNHVPDKDKEGPGFYNKLGVPKGTRLLYNLHALVEDTEKPVLIVEGEKTCDAASKLLKNFTVITYSGGVQTWSATDWEPLCRNSARTIYVWPDADKPKGNKPSLGISVFQKLANYLLQQGITELLSPFTNDDGFLEYTSQFEVVNDKWDLADEFPKDFDLHAFIASARSIKIQVTDDEPLSTKIDKIVKLYDQKWRKILIRNSVAFVDITSGSAYNVDTLGYTLCKYEKDIKHCEPEKIPGEDDFAIDVWLNHSMKPVITKLTFDPSTTDSLITVNNVESVNMFRGLAIQSKKAESPEAIDSIKAWFELVYSMMGKEQGDYYISFQAQILKNPSNKPGKMIVLCGAQGIGKTMLTKALQPIFGPRLMAAPNITSVKGSRFNSLMSNKLLLILDEFGIASRHDNDFATAMKTYITEPSMAIELKGFDTIMAPSYIRFIGTTNNRASLSIPRDDRRFAIFEALPSYVKDPNLLRRVSNLFHEGDAINGHYREFNEALAGLHHELINFKLVNLDVIPNTSIRDDAAKETDPVYNEIYEILMKGEIPHELINMFPNEKLSELGPDPKFIFKRCFVDFILNELKNKHINIISRIEIGKKLMSIFPFEKGLKDKYVKKGLDYNEPFVGNGITYTQEYVIKLTSWKDARHNYQEVTNSNITWDHDPDTSIHLFDTKTEVNKKEVF